MNLIILGWYLVRGEKRFSSQLMIQSVVAPIILAMVLYVSLRSSRTLRIWFPSVNNCAGYSKDRGFAAFKVKWQKVNATLWLCGLFAIN